MEWKDKRYQAYLDILNKELVPAMGCTEPIAVAYCAAKARAVLGMMPTRVEIALSGNIIKNVKSVIVPNTGGEKGIETAAAIGILAGKEELGLEVLSHVTQADKSALILYREKTEFIVKQVDGDLLLDISVRVWSGEKSAAVRIINEHTNIVYIEDNGNILLEQAITEPGNALDTDYEMLTIDAILDFAESVRIEDVKLLLDRQIRYNTAISVDGLKKDYGANIGSVLLSANCNDVRTRARARAAAGADARMGGSELPVIINSGSGNQGMTVSLPVIEYAEALHTSKEQLYRALVISNLVAIHQKTGIGYLSAYCGAVSAGAAAGAAIAYLHGENYDGVAATIINALATTSGIVCDGAKPSCAAKIATAVDAGIMGYEMYKNGQRFSGGDGVVSEDVEDTIDNIGRLGRDGMRETDKEILCIMTCVD